MPTNLTPMMGLFYTKRLTVTSETPCGCEECQAAAAKHLCITLCREHEQTLQRELSIFHGGPATFTFTNRVETVFDVRLERGRVTKKPCDACAAQQEVTSVRAAQ